MSVDAFFAWQEAQAERCDRVGGVPMRRMAGARSVRDDIDVTIVALMRSALRGSGSRPSSGDGSVATRPGQIRRPDMGVDAGPCDPNVSKAVQPRAVIDVSYPSTRDVDAFATLVEYRPMADLERIVPVEPVTAEMHLWSRGSNRLWIEECILGLDTNIPLTAPDIATPAADIYDGVTFPARLARVAGPAADEAGGSTA